MNSILIIQSKKGFRCFLMCNDWKLADLGALREDVGDFYMVRLSYPTKTSPFLEHYFRISIELSKIYSHSSSSLFYSMLSYY